MSLDQPDPFVKSQTLTHDAFLGGRLTVSQPRNGFRAGLDSVLLGAAVRPAAASLLDLGAGAGTASLVALAHERRISAVLVDRDAGMLALARANADANGLGDRVRTIALDVVAAGAERQAAGVAPDSFSAVIANPPFFDAAAGTRAGEPRRATARHMAAGDLDLWVRAAAAAAAPGGEIVFVYPAAGLASLLAAFSQRFGAVAILPLSPRASEPASRVLMRGTKGSRAPMTLLATRALHVAGRDFTPEFEAIFRGEARLDW